MSMTIRIKRRISGAPGAPSALKTAEPAMNFVDEVLYLGKGDDGNGNATSVIPIGGKGAFLDLSSDQSVGGIKTFSVSPILPTPSAGDNSQKGATTAWVRTYVSSLGGGGDMFKSTYDADNDGVVDNAEALGGQAGSYYLSRANHTGTQAIATISGLQAALDALAPLASPTFTGTPAAPTAVAGTSTTQIATTAFVMTAIGNLINAAPGALDTLNELAAALGNDPNFASTITSALAGKANLTLSNLSDAAAARTNLGLGSLATQNAGSVNITGGSINGIDLDGGTF